MDSMPMSNPMPQMPEQREAGQQMGVWFYWGKEVYLLFPGWKTESIASYLLSLLAIFLLAIIHEWVRNLPHGINRLEGALTASAFPTWLSKIIGSGTSFKVSNSTTLLAVQTLVHTLTAFTSYLLMLLVMSYNVGVLLSVLSGLAVGYASFRAVFNTHNEIVQTVKQSTQQINPQPEVQITDY